MRGSRLIAHLSTAAEPSRPDGAQILVELIENRANRVVQSQGQVAALERHVRLAVGRRYSVPCSDKRSTVGTSWSSAPLIAGCGDVAWHILLTWMRSRSTWQISKAYMRVEFTPAGWYPKENAG